MFDGVGTFDFEPVEVLGQLLAGTASGLLPQLQLSGRRSRVVDDDGCVDLGIDRLDGRRLELEHRPRHGGHSSSRILWLLGF